MNLARRRIIALSLMACAAMLAGCAPARSRRQPPPPPPVPPAELPPQFAVVDGVAGADDIARFLAGRPVRSGAVLSRLQVTADYQLHYRELKAAWDQFAGRRVGRMREWSAVRIAPAIGGARVVFYPFGGPDLLHVHSMFPFVPAALLMGLEPVGDVPPLESLPPAEVFELLATYREATRTQLRTGYFITKDMRSDLGRGGLRGVIPVLLGTVGIAGGTVESLTPGTFGGNPGVELRYRSAWGAARRAVYVAGDLSNSGFKGPYRDWLASHGRGATYFKAASYLMHDSRFSAARDFFLEQSDSILQDDSGIPFRHFAPERWSIQFFGNYVQPIELFAKHQQPDLRAAYLAHPSELLPFGSGYHYEPADANLILALRRQPRSP